MPEEIKYPLFSKEVYREHFKCGFFILYGNTGSKFGKAIKRRQLAEGFTEEEADMVHIEVLGAYSVKDQKRYSINISPPRAKMIDFLKVHAGRYVWIVTYDDEKFLASDRKSVAWFAATLCNKGYDIRGVLSFIFKFIKQDNRLWFCSEGATWSLQHIRPRAFNGEGPSRIMPANYCRLTVRWKGFLPKDNVFGELII